jgi:hypothetical protein
MTTILPRNFVRRFDITQYRAGLGWRKAFSSLLGYRALLRARLVESGAMLNCSGMDGLSAI